MELTDILICPRTGSRLHVGDGDSVVRVHGSDVIYPIVDGIVDFCPNVNDKISKAYDASSSLYDAYHARSSGEPVVWLLVLFFEVDPLGAYRIQSRRCGLSAPPRHVAGRRRRVAADDPEVRFA